LLGTVILLRHQLRHPETALLTTDPHDHYYASLLISSGLDVKVVQARLRHASAKTTLDTYGHLFPDSDEKTRAAIGDVMTTRSQNLAATVRPTAAVIKRLS
jgi:integrase